MNFSLKRCHLDLDLLEGRPNAAASEENEGNISVLIFENQRQTFLQATWQSCSIKPSKERI
jgi:hypothetical protein